MKMTQKERFGAMSILSMFFMSGLGFDCAFSTFCTDAESLPIETGVRRTSAIIAYLSKVDGYTQVYVDKDTDFTIYVKEEYIAEDLPLSNVVSLARTAGTMSSVPRQESSVTVDDIPKIVSGVSGESVHLNDAPIEFVSGWDGRGLLRRIFY